jgi:hypothetical protein
MCDILKAAGLLHFVNIRESQPELLLNPQYVMLTLEVLIGIRSKVF